MKLKTLLTWLLPSVVAAVDSTSPQMLLFDSEISSEPSSQSAIDASTARMILAERLGLSQFYSLEDFRMDQIEQIDKLSGPKASIFGDDSASRRSKVLVVIEGVGKELRHELNDLMNLGAVIEDRPTELEIEKLIASLREKANALGRVDGNHDYASVSGLEGLTESRENKITIEAGRTIVHIKNIPQSSGKQSIETILSFIKDLSTNTASHISTVLLLPSYLNNNKRSVSSGWALSAREEILSATPEAPSGSPKVSTSSPIKLSSKAGSREPIPKHFPSLDACQSGTANCSSHGSCVVVAKEEHPDRESTSIYGCACKAQSKDLPKGSKQTYHYGGNACEKIDLSAPFWLFAGVGVGLLTILSMGIGLLYTMGAEELPSVIGAGVSSARNK